MDDEDNRYRYRSVYSIRTSGLDALPAWRDDDTGVEELWARWLNVVTMHGDRINFKDAVSPIQDICDALDNMGSYFMSHMIMAMALHRVSHPYVFKSSDHYLTSLNMTHCH